RRRAPDRERQVERRARSFGIPREGEELAGLGADLGERTLLPGVPERGRRAIEQRGGLVFETAIPVGPAQLRAEGPPLGRRERERQPGARLPQPVEGRERIASEPIAPA